MANVLLKRTNEVSSTASPIRGPHRFMSVVDFKLPSTPMSEYLQSRNKTNEVTKHHQSNRDICSSKESVKYLICWTPKLSRRKLIVEGNLLDFRNSTSSVERWISSKIVGVQDSRNLLTKNSRYVLEGKLSLLHAHNLCIPQFIIDAFSNGFPEDWKTIRDSWRRFEQEQNKIAAYSFVCESTASVCCSQSINLSGIHLGASTSVQESSCKKVHTASPSSTLSLSCLQRSPKKRKALISGKSDQTSGTSDIFEQTEGTSVMTTNTFENEHATSTGGPVICRKRPVGRPRKHPVSGVTATRSSNDRIEQDRPTEQSSLKSSNTYFLRKNLSEKSLFGGTKNTCPARASILPTEPPKSQSNTTNGALMPGARRLPGRPRKRKPNQNGDTAAVEEVGHAVKRTGSRVQPARKLKMMSSLSKRMMAKKAESLGPPQTEAVVQKKANKSRTKCRTTVKKATRWPRKQESKKSTSSLSEEDLDKNKIASLRASNKPKTCSNRQLKEKCISGNSTKKPPQSVDEPLTITRNQENESTPKEASTVGCTEAKKCPFTSRGSRTKVVSTVKGKAGQTRIFNPRPTTATQLWQNSQILREINDIHHEDDVFYSDAIAENVSGAITKSAKTMRMEIADSGSDEMSIYSTRTPIRDYFDKSTIISPKVSNSSSPIVPYLSPNFQHCVKMGHKLKEKRHLARQVSSTTTKENIPCKSLGKKVVLDKLLKALPISPTVGTASDSDFEQDQYSDLSHWDRRFHR